MPKKAEHGYACGLTDTTDGDTSPIFYVDLPDPNTVGDEDNGWVNVGRFRSRAEAVAWIRENVGDCDEDGRIRLIAN